MTKLGVNIDHIATIREARRAVEPDPVAAAVLAELAGAHGITVHLRGDRRHIKERDVRLLREVITTRLNIEMAVTDEMVSIALEIKPDLVTFVPERENELTTEGGLDAAKSKRAITGAVRRLEKAGISVSLFIDPDARQITAAAGGGAGAIELNTNAYAKVAPKGLDERDPRVVRELDLLSRTAEMGAENGLRILAGHGLTYRNVRPVSDIYEIDELNIGHNIVARSALVGMEEAVREMLLAMNG